MIPMNRRAFVAAAAGAAAAAVSLNPQTAQAHSGRHRPTTPSPTDTDGLPYDDQEDFTDADRGFIAAFTGGPISTKAGKTAWDPDAYQFLVEAKASPPDSVDPSLWRQARRPDCRTAYAAPPSALHRVPPTAPAP